MNHLKHLQFLILLLVCSILNAQCPPSTPGYLSGNTTTIISTDTTPAPVFTINPSGLPNTEFIFIQKDSMASDSLGHKVLGTNADGRVVPADYGLTTCNELSIVAVSFDLNQLKTLVDTLYGANYQVGVSCCDAAANFFTGFCDSLDAYGINSSADINNLSDFLTLMSIFAGTTGGSLSLNNITGTIDQVNSIMTLFGPCAANITELCYAVINADSAMDHYIITHPNTPYSINITQDTVRLAPGDTANLTVTFLPSSATDSLLWYNTDSLSSIHVNSNTGQITNTGVIADTAWIVAESLTGCGTDTAIIIVDPTISIQLIDITKIPLQVSPNPFDNSINVNFYTQEGNYLLQLIGITGQILLSQNQYFNKGNQKIEIKTNNIPEGYYFLRITGSKTQGTQAVLKN